MQIFETIEIEITNKKTGQKTTRTRRQVAGSRCDYSGRLIKNEFNLSYCSYICDYGNQDSCFGASGDEFMFGKIHGIDMHYFMSQPYEFYDDSHDSGEFGNEETSMMRELTSMKIGDGGDGSFPTLESAFRFFRLRAAKRLVDQGIIHPDDLKEEL
jgi:hypothetical protein